MFVAVLLVTLNHLQAQTMQWSGQTIGVVQSAPPDSIVQVAADAQGLQQVALADLPRGGTFWYVTPGGIAAPFPCPPPDENAIIYAITDTQFLVDQTGGQVTVNTHRLGMQNTTASTVDAALSAQADAVVNLIVKIQTEDEYQQMRSMARAFGMDVPTPGDGGSYGDTNSFGYFFNYTFDTNQLWLEIMNVSNGWSGLNLHNATNQVYAIWGTTNLLGTWNVETELWPTTDQTNAMPFAIQNLDRQDLFLRAEDWTGVDSNGDGIPDWWIFKFFGDLSETSTNLDSQGNTLGYDFTNGIDPNIITFTVEAANDYVNTTTANVQLNITAGVPSFYALLVNSNPTTNWLPFTSTNLTVMLGSTDGVYNVSVGLKGLPVDATETWSDYIFTLDRTAPMVTLSTPVNGSVSKPYFQLGGLADKPVRVAYDLNNAAGTVTNENGFVTDQTYDPAQGLYTTNFFQCFDIPLATNINYLTLHVTDRAGNVATTNFTVTLDYSIATNPPVVTLIWPQDGMAVSGSNCTIRGTMSDETGSVMAQVINGDGTTNQITGLVERNGNFWLENVPLNGTNQITLQAADASGNNVATTNFIVNPSSLNLTIDSTPTGNDLYQPYGSVSGTVSDGSATVTVNGAAATVSGNNWTATNVPISDQGTALFDVKAQVGGNPAANGSAEQEKPAQAVMVEYSNSDDWRIDENGTNYWRWFWNTDYHRQTSDDGTMPGGFHATQQYEWNDFGAGELEHLDWTQSGGFSYRDGITNVYNAGPLTSPDVDDLDYYVRHYYAHNCTSTLWGNMTISEEAHTKVKLFTGGKSKVGRQNLFQLQAFGTAYGNPQNLFWNPTPASTIPPQTLAVGGLGAPGSDGNLWVVLPDNTNVDITIAAPKQNKHFDAWANPTKYKLQIVVNGSNPLWPDLVPDYNKYCVGQYLGFDQQFIPALPETPRYNPIQWVLDGVYVNTNLPLQYSDGSSNYSNNPAFLKSQSTHAWWIDGAYDPPPSKASIGEGLTFANGQYVAIATHGIFTIHRPRLVNYIADTDSIGEAVLHAHATGDPASGDKLACAPGANYDLQVESRFSGGAFVTQTLNGQRTNHVYCFSYTNGDYLDKTEVYGVPFDETNRLISVIPNVVSTPLHFEDQPSIICIGNTSDHIHFTDYIRFQPDGGIPVTLGIVTWHNAGDTSLSTISGTTNQDYIPFPSSTDPQSESTGAYLSPTGSAAFDNFTTDSTLARWIHNATNSVTVSY